MLQKDELLQNTYSFTKIDNRLNDYYLKELSPSEYKLIMCIIRFTQGFQRETFTTKIMRLAKSTNMSRNTIKSSLKKLQEYKLIEVKKEKDTIYISYLRSNSKIQHINYLQNNLDKVCG